MNKSNLPSRGSTNWGASYNNYLNELERRITKLEQPTNIGGSLETIYTAKGSGFTAPFTFIFNDKEKQPNNLGIYDINDTDVIDLKEVYASFIPSVEAEGLDVTGREYDFDAVVVNRNSAMHHYLVRNPNSDIASTDQSTIFVLDNNHISIGTVFDINGHRWFLPRVDDTTQSSMDRAERTAPIGLIPTTNEGTLYNGNADFKPIEMVEDGPLLKMRRFFTSNSVKQGCSYFINSNSLSSSNTKEFTFNTENDQSGYLRVDKNGSVSFKEENPDSLFLSLPYDKEMFYGVYSTVIGIPMVIESNVVPTGDSSLSEVTIQNVDIAVPRSVELFSPVLLFRVGTNTQSMRFMKALDNGIAPYSLPNIALSTSKRVAVGDLVFTDTNSVDPIKLNKRSGIYFKPDFYGVDDNDDREILIKGFEEENEKTRNLLTLSDLYEVDNDELYIGPFTPHEYRRARVVFRNAAATFSNSTLYVNGNSYIDMETGAQIKWTSDERLKHNINPFTKDALSIVSKTPIKTFAFNGSEQEQIGVIAQELQKALGEDADKFVATDENGYLSIYETKLVFLLWKALQEEKAKTDNILRRLEALENKIGR